VPSFELLAAEYKSKAEFLYVSTREPHAKDVNTFGSGSGRMTPDGPDGRWDVMAPKTNQEHQDQLKDWYKDLSQYIVSLGGDAMKVPYVFDGTDNATMLAYNCYPFRMFIVKDGKVAYRNIQGPVAQSLKHLRKTLASL